MLIEENKVEASIEASTPNTSTKVSRDLLNVLFDKKAVEVAYSDKRVSVSEFNALCKGVYSTRASAAATALYITLNLVEKMSTPKGKDDVTTAVDKLTPWELFLCHAEKVSRATHRYVETHENQQIDPESLAKCSLLWLARNNKQFQNQPFDVVLDQGNGKIDPRQPTFGQFKAAVRQPDGKYKVIGINQKYVADRQNLSMYTQTGQLREDIFEVLEGVENPLNVQIVVDNRLVPKEHGNHLNELLSSALVGLASDEKGIISMSSDHLYMDGVAANELCLALGRYASVANNDLKENYPENAGIPNPLLELDYVTPSIYKLSNTEALRAFAKAMLKTGKYSPRDTILVPTIGRFDDLILDEFTDSKDFPGKESHRRIQPLAFTLQSLADDQKASDIRTRLKNARNDINSSVTTYIFSVVHSPKIPETIRNMLIKKIPKMPGISRLAERLYGVGLFSIPGEIKTNSDEDNFYTKSPRENIHNVSNTMKSMTTNNAINLVATTTDNRKIFNISGSEGSFDFAKLMDFAKLLEEECKKILDAKVG